MLVGIGGGIPRLPNDFGDVQMSLAHHEESSEVLYGL